jgi:serine protease AprX
VKTTVSRWGRIAVAGMTLTGISFGTAIPVQARQANKLNVSPRATRVTYVINARPGELAQVADAVAQAGGHPSARYDSVDSLRVALTATQLAQVKNCPSVVSATADAAIKPLGGAIVGGTTPTTMNQVDTAIGATASWAAGYTGKGVSVVVIDSGIAPVKGIDKARLINGPDLSFDAITIGPNGQGLDTYGHGTHMAGIIGGRDPGAALNDPNAFIGVAPEVNIINIKAGAYDGASDVSQVIAAFDWAVANQAKYNIKAINLSYGTDSTQDWKVDPLSWAAEVAWRRGITVLVATGNDGNKSSTKNPAFNPTIIAVGAADTETLAGATFSSGGGRKPDVAAPGARIESLRVPGSMLDDQHPKPGDRFLRGSGTSQATAVVTGAVALLAQEFPTAMPDDFKKALIKSGVKISNGKPVGGFIDLVGARAELSRNRGGKEWNKTDTLTAKDLSTRGRGSLNAARGQSIFYKKGQPIVGEVDAFGNPWNGSSWTGSSWTGSSWTSGRWNGSSWTGSSWTGSSWTGSSWTGSSWTGSSWTGKNWSGSSWTGSSWTGSSWTGSSWTGTNDWSGTWDQ